MSNTLRLVGCTHWGGLSCSLVNVNIISYISILIVFLNIFVWVINIALGWSYSVRWSGLQLPGRTVASWHAHNYNYIHTMFTITYVRLCNTIVCNYKHFLTYLQLQWHIQCLSWHQTSLSTTLSHKPFPLKPRWLIVEVEFVCARVFLQIERHREVIDDTWVVLWGFVMLYLVLLCVSWMLLDCIIMSYFTPLHIPRHTSWMK